MERVIQLHIMLFQVSNQVAFTALAKGGNPDPNSKIPFDNVITNEGSAYNGNDTFKCPTNGIYAFTVTLTGDQGIQYFDY